MYKASAAKALMALYIRSSISTVLVIGWPLASVRTPLVSDRFRNLRLTNNDTDHYLNEYQSNHPI